MSESVESEVDALQRELAAARGENAALTQSLAEHRRLVEGARDAHAALAASEERFRILFDRSPDALMTLEPPEWKFTSANPAMLAMFGIRDDAELRTLDAERVSPELQPDGRTSAENAREVIALAMRNGAHAFEWTHRRLSGEDFPATVVLVRVEFHGVRLLQAIVHDETDERRVQASLAQRDRLASMGMLAAGVAHEINNPLAYVLASVEALAEALPTLPCVADKDDLLEAAASALEGTRRIAGIARGLSTFARVERMECTKVDLHQAIESAATIAHNEIKYRATLVRDYAELPLLWASEGKLSQVFLNLLINAAHATPEGDAAAHRITVRTWVVGDDVFAEISDTGAGIAPEHLERVFEPFFTTKKAGRGSGLGLAICRTLLAEVGGELRVESELGRGTRVVVRLPVVRTDAGTQAAAPAAKPPSILPPARGRVLVVDDEEHIRSVMQRMLRRAHDVVTVASGREAQALLEQDAAFDVVLCDLMMPELSGPELHAWLAARHPALARRVVFVSGGAFTPEASEYLESVENRQLGKPFEVRELQSLVAEMVERAG